MPRTPVPAIGGRDLLNRVMTHCEDCGWPPKEARGEKSTDAGRKHRDRTGHTVISVITKVYRFRGDQRSPTELSRRWREARDHAEN